MSLTDELLHLKNNFLKAASSETIAEMEKATRELGNTNILSKSLRKGDTAPDFTLKNGKGLPIQLTQKIKEGPVLLKFFRGDW